MARITCADATASRAIAPPATPSRAGRGGGIPHIQRFLEALQINHD